MFNVGNKFMKVAQNIVDLTNERRTLVDDVIIVIKSRIYDMTQMLKVINKFYIFIVDMKWSHMNISTM